MEYPRTYDGSPVIKAEDIEVPPSRGRPSGKKYINVLQLITEDGRAGYWCTDCLVIEGSDVPPPDIDYDAVRRVTRHSASVHKVRVPQSFAALTIEEVFERLQLSENRVADVERDADAKIERAEKASIKREEELLDQIAYWKEEAVKNADAARRWNAARNLFGGQS